MPALDTLPWIQKNRRIFFLGSWLGGFIGGQQSAGVAGRRRVSRAPPDVAARFATEILQTATTSADRSHSRYASGVALNQQRTAALSADARAGRVRSSAGERPRRVVVVEWAATSKSASPTTQAVSARASEGEANRSRRASDRDIAQPGLSARAQGARGSRQYSAASVADRSSYATRSTARWAPQTAPDRSRRTSGPRSAHAALPPETTSSGAPANVRRRGRSPWKRRTAGALPPARSPACRSRRARTARNHSPDQRRARRRPFSLHRACANSWRGSYDIPSRRNCNTALGEHGDQVRRQIVEQSPALRGAAVRGRATLGSMPSDASYARQTARSRRSSASFARIDRRVAATECDAHRCADRFRRTAAQRLRLPARLAAD